MLPTIAETLRRRVRERGPAPFLTYYDVGSSERTELSAVTFANWVDKTANLLLDELGVELGDAVRLQLAESHPGHWVTLIWELACWEVGAVVSLTEDAPAVLVIGPGTGWAASRQTQVVFCGLHPLGLPGPEAGSGEVLDYNLEVRGQADQHPLVRQPASARAWEDRQRTLTQADLVTDPAEAGRRVLVRPSDPWTTARQALLTPLLTDGSAVVVVGDPDSSQLARIQHSEQAARLD